MSMLVHVQEEETDSLGRDYIPALPPVLIGTKMCEYLW